MVLMSTSDISISGDMLITMIENIVEDVRTTRADVRDIKYELADMKREHSADLKCVKDTLDILTKSLLNKENRIAVLESPINQENTKMELRNVEQKMEISELEHSRKKMLLYIGIAGAVLVSFITTVLGVVGKLKGWW